MKIYKILTPQKNIFSTFPLLEPLFSEVKKNIKNNYKNPLPSKEIIKRVNQIKKIERKEPLLSVLRMQKNSYIFCALFKNLKSANDVLGQTTVDIFLNYIKAILFQNFYHFYPTERLIKSDYKGLVFNIRNQSSNEIIKNIFYEDPNNLKNKIFQNEIFRSELYLIGYKKRLLQLNKEGKLNNLTPYDFENYLEYGINSIQEIKEKLGINPNDLDIQEEIQIMIKHLNKINIGIGYTYLKSENDIEKIHSLRKAEIAAKTSEKKPKKYTKQIINKNLKKAFDAEKEIFDNYKNCIFFEGEQKYPIIINNNINPLLLRFSRKGNKINNKNLNKLIEKYITGLNNALDFIVPGSTDFKEEIKNSKIKMKLLKDYKYGKINTLPEKDTKFNDIKISSKPGFLEEIEEKNGVAIFIDIKDMGILNLLDFQNVGKKYIKQQNEDLLLTTGESVTKKFFNLVDSITAEIKHKNNLYVTLGGDEIYLFLEETEKSYIKNFIENIKSNLIKEGLTGRISYNFLNTKPEKTFNDLDTSTQFIKEIEKFLENLYSKNWIFKENEEFLKHFETYYSNIDVNMEPIEFDPEIIKNSLKNSIFNTSERLENFIINSVGGKIPLVSGTSMNINLIKNQNGLSIEIKSK